MVVVVVVESPLIGVVAVNHCALIKCLVAVLNSKAYEKVSLG